MKNLKYQFGSGAVVQRALSQGVVSKKGVSFDGCFSMVGTLGFKFIAISVTRKHIYAQGTRHIYAQGTSMHKAHLCTRHIYAQSTSMHSAHGTSRHKAQGTSRHKAHGTSRHKAHLGTSRHKAHLGTRHI